MHRLSSREVPGYRGPSPFAFQADLAAVGEASVERSHGKRRATRCVYRDRSAFVSHDRSQIGLFVRVSCPGRASGAGPIASNAPIMNAILIKIFATALTLSQVLTRPEAVKTDFDPV